MKGCDLFLDCYKVCYTCSSQFVWVCVAALFLSSLGTRMKPVGGWKIGHLLCGEGMFDRKMSMLDGVQLGCLWMYIELWMI